MTMMHDEGKPSLESLAHHGVKGMKWGTHKARPTAHDIGAARARQLVRAHDIGTARGERSAARKTGDVRKVAKAQKNFDTAVKNFNTAEDRKTAARLTRGEKAALLILSGPIGAVAIGVNAGGRQLVNRSVDKHRAKN